MIETTAAAALVQELPVPDPDFRVEPQADAQVVVPAALEVFSRVGSAEVEWSEANFVAAVTDADGILQHAIEASAREATRNPQSARARVNYGLAFLNAGAIEGAAAQFELACSLAPRDATALAHLARVRLLQHKPHEARELAARLSVLDTTAASLADLLNASAAMLAGEPAKAAEALIVATRRTPNDWLPFYLLGFLYIARGDGKEAVAYLRAAARNRPRSAAVQHALGVAFGLMAEWRKAARAFRQALVLAPRRRESILALAHVFLRLHSPDEAIQLLSTWTSVVTHDRETQELLAVAYRTADDVRSARRHLLMALQSVTSSAENSLDRGRILNNIGVCAATLGDMEEAALWYSRSIQAVPSMVAFRNLALAYRELGDLEAAYRILAAASGHDPDDASAKLLTARLAADLGRVDEAVAILKELIKRGDATSDTYVLLGYILSDEKRDYAAAVEALREGFRRYSSEPVIANNLAYVHLMRGDAAQAKEILASLDPREIADSVYLTATSGLLKLVEGDMEGGLHLYAAAEQLARREGRSDLVKIVRQKMHLEFARALIRRDAPDEALEHVKSGLAVRGRRSYENDLKNLWGRLLQS